MGQIYEMRAADAAGVAVDYEVIQVLKNSVGNIRYEEIAEEATFKLADRLGRLDRAMREGEYEECYRQALTICGIASQIGLSGVAKVATDAMNCARDENEASLPAVIVRLNRLAEASLFSVFEAG